MTPQLLSFISSLVGGVTHIPRLRDPPGFWEHVQKTRGETDPWAWQQESGVEWGLVVLALAGLIYVGFWSRRLMRFLSEKRERRRHRTIHPIPEAEDPERQFKDYRQR